MKALAVVVMVLGAQAIFAGSRLDQAIAEFRAGDCKGVIETLSQPPLLDAAAGDTPYWLLAECSLRLGRSEQATQALREGLAAVPASAVLKRMLGQELFRQDPASAEAGQLLRASAAALPRDPESRHYFAQWAYLNNRDSDCIQNEREALLLPGLGVLAKLQMNTLLGMCESRIDHTAAARTAFETAQKINRGLPQFDPGSAYQYARFLADCGETSRMEAVISDILTHCPRYAPAHLERAKWLDRSRKPSQAIEEAELAISGEGNDEAAIRAAHLILAKSYFVLGQTDKADQEQKWIESHPAFPAR